MAAVKTLPLRVRLEVLVRSFAVQGSWNYETLIGTGFAFTILPVLRYLHGRDAEAVRAALGRHAVLFNSHPYLVPLAAGAVARLEAEGTPAQTMERFKAALRASLGAVGDQLVWSAWRPFCALVGILVLLGGGPWWLAVGLFLALYNALHLALRVWGLGTGWRSGIHLARAVRESPLARLGHAAANGAALLIGVCGGFLAVQTASATPVLLVPAAMMVGWFFSFHARPLTAGVLLLAWLAATLHGILPHVGV